MLLTIITITKQDPAGLGRTLRSTGRISNDSVEHLVVTVRSEADDTSSAIRAVGSSARIIVQPTDGIAEAFSAGLASAQGEWVWFLNGGDAVHETLECGWLISLLQHTRAEVITGALQFDGDAAPRPAPPLKYQWPLVRCWLMHPATIVRRQRLCSAGGFDARWRVAMDFELWQRLIRDDVAIDVISRPFARFARAGVSERDEGRLARAEEAAVLRKYSGRIALAVGRQVLGAGRRLLQAFRLWPDGRSGPRDRRVLSE